MSEQWLRASVQELAAAVRGGQVTSRELVEVFIAQIERVNPTLNAVVAKRYDAARAEADAADRALQQGRDDLGPLHGVPCSIKECFRLTDMPNTAGLVARKGILADGDATAVARLRAAGAIPLAVTNTSELCMWMESANRLYGRSNNPYDPDRIVGGSSGGEGAIVAAAGAPFGLGSDVGGSIRMPAFFNGIFGHKGSGGLIPNTGQFPASALGPAERYLTTGPLVRYATDLWPLIRILAGPDGQDGGAREFSLGDPAAVDLSRLRVLNVPDNGRTRVHPELVAAQQRAAEALAAAGARVESANFGALQYSFEIWSSMLGSAEPPSKFRKLLGYESAWPLFWQLVLWSVRLSPHTLPALILALTENVTHWTPKRTARFVAMGKELKAELAATLGDDAVLLYPSYPEPAPRHIKPLFPPFNWVYTAIWNVMELPVTQVPLGLSTAGLPLGVQVAANVGCDHLTVAVAMELERACGGWVPPPRWLAGDESIH